MRHFHLKRNKYYCPVINVERLWEMIPIKVRDAAAKRDDGKVPVLDLVRRVRIFLSTFCTFGNTQYMLTLYTALLENWHFVVH